MIFQGNVSLEIIRNNNVIWVNNKTNNIHENLFQDISGSLYSGSALNIQVDSIVAHFHQMPNLTFNEMVNSYPLGFQFNRPLSSFSSNNSSTFIQTIYVPVQEPELVFSIKSFTLGRLFQSVTGNSISSQYVQYTPSLRSKFGQVNRIYAYLTSDASNIQLKEADQFRVTWNIKTL